MPRRDATAPQVPVTVVDGQVIICRSISSRVAPPHRPNGSLNLGKLEARSPQHRAVAYYHGFLDRMLKLANVAGPIV